MTARIINSQLTLKLCRICYSSWILTNLWGLMGFIPDSSLLKELADVIAKYLWMILEWSWESGEVSADWKLANVDPIFKKGKKEDPGNDRPVSLTSMSGKVTKIILGDTENHLKDKTITGHS
ncbi:RNA-directed DNA polymerase from mobile element jockey [Willisornis vidua]|uniref:RNA-directed DNA polymerase from mobile element jockey n=1 Tax=Willisornis vidua TaxID=1566151 RepID=A0ABQ9CVC2_9PASS|nr:RNA-directed DNA polymerase from mobile element jockey [Willisornis vidua]